MSYNEENKIKFQGDVFMKYYEMMDEIRELLEKCEFIANFNKKRFIKKQENNGLNKDSLKSKSIVK